MPQVVIPAIISTVAGAAAGTISGSVFAFFIRALLASAVAYAIGKATAPKISANTNLQDRVSGLKRMVRLSAQPHRIIYGEQVVSGNIVFISTTGSQNSYLHIVLALAGHEIESVDKIWLGDKLSTDPIFSNLVFTKVHLGSPDQTADTDLVAQVPEWTVDHRLRGIAYIYIRLKWDPNVWVNGIPNIKALVKGKKLYDPRDGVTRWSQNWALVVRDYLSSDYGLNADTNAGEIDDAYTTSAANICDELVLYPNNTPTADLVDDASTTVNETLYASAIKGVADSSNYIVSVYMKQGTASQTQLSLVFTTGTVQNSADIVITWSSIPSYATSGTANNISGGISEVGSGWYRVWVTGSDISDNTTVQATIYPAGYATDGSTLGTVYVDGAQLSNNSELVEYERTNGSTTDNNLLLYSDDFRQWSGSATVTADQDTCPAYHQRRYTCDGVIMLDTTPANVINDLVTASAGAVTYVQGKYRIHAGAYDAPVASLDEGDLRDTMSVQARMARKELFNAVRGTFVDKNRSWEATDFPPATNSQYELEDGGERIFRDIELPFTTDVHRAQRIAKIHLERARQAITITFPAKLSALDITVWDIVTLNITDMGWSNKPFRVMSWSLNEYGGIELVLREESSTVYDWMSSDGTVPDSAPNTNLPDPWTVQPPTALTLSSGDNELLVGQDGTIVSRIHATWQASTDPHLYRYDVEFKKTTDLVWFPFTATTKDITEAFIAPVNDGETYDVRVSAINTLGVRSSWETITGHTVVGKSNPPPDVDTFYVERQPDGTREFSWTYSNPPPDLAGFEIRYINGTGTYTWDQLTPLHDGLLQTSPYETNQLAAGQYVCAIKAVDTSGNYSTNALFISSTLGDPRIGTALASAIEHPTWPYTKTNCRVEEDGYLWADDPTTWDTAPATWDAWTYWHNDVVSSFVYQHGQTDDTDAIDLGVDVAVEPLTDYTLNDCTVVTEYAWRKEADTGYSAWTSNPGVITARYILVRATFTPISSLAHVRSMRTLIVADIKTDDITDLDTSTLTGSYRIGVGDIRLPITKPFQIVYVVNIALQNVGSGWTWELVDKDVTVGPRIRIYNASGTLADATIDATVKGAV